MTPNTFVVHSMRHGQLVGSAGTTSTIGNMVSLDPTSDLFPGDLIQATVSSKIRGANGQPARPHVWQFRAAVERGDANFSGGLPNLGDHRSTDVSLGDVDGDGDIDAFVANAYDQPNRIWQNEGGQFSDSGQLLGDQRSTAVSLGDLDGDGDLDAFVANYLQGNRIWLNDAGIFSDSGQSLGDQHSVDVALGDIDGDGDLGRLRSELFERA